MSVLKKIDEGKSYRAVSTEIGVEKTQIQTIVKFREFRISCCVREIKNHENVGVAPRWVPGVVSVLPVTCTLWYLGAAN